MRWRTAGSGRDARAVAEIVGRDPSALDEAGVARAAIESLAENFSDGVVAPAFYLALFGLPGGAAYKAANTADSMIGHRTRAPRRLRLRGRALRRSREPAGLAPCGALARASRRSSCRAPRPPKRCAPRCATRTAIARPTPAGPRPPWRARSG